MKNVTTLLMVIVIFSVSGCGNRWFTPRETNPIVEDYVSNNAFNPRFAIVSTRPDRRSVFINVDRNSRPSLRNNICAEPPADVAEAYARSVEANILQELASGQSTNAAFGSNLNTAVAQLTPRTQGLQWMRDQMFHLCLDRLNGAIGERQYAVLKQQLWSMSSDLIKAELSNRPAQVQAIATLAQAEANLAATKAKPATPAVQTPAPTTKK